MNKAILYVFSLFASVTLAADFNPFDGPKPIAVLIQSDPWAMVIGSDTPRVAIYESGEVIFIKKVNGVHAYHHIKLDEAALASFREQAQPVMALKSLKIDYDIAPDVTDLPQAMFYLCDGAHDVVTTVYGLMASGTKLPAWTKFSGSLRPEQPPKELLQLHKWLCAFDPAQSELWTPKYIEVMFSDYSNASDTSIQWPKEWPSLKSGRTIKRGNAYSIFLEGALLPKLKELLSTRKDKGAIELEGRKWTVSYRFTFPSEPTWRAAFEKSEKK